MKVSPAQFHFVWFKGKRLRLNIVKNVEYRFGLLLAYFVVVDE